MFSRAPLLRQLQKRMFGRSRREKDAGAAWQRAAAEPQEVQQVYLSFLNGSLLAIGISPAFRFNPEGHKLYRATKGEVVEVQGSRIRVVFDVGQHRSPPMAWSTAFLQAFWPLRVPALPPGLSIEMKSKELQGWIDLSKGTIDLSFVSEFDNQALGRNVSAEPLQIVSRMTTGVLRGEIFHACGEPVDPETARAKLVAVSRVPKTKDAIQNWLLGLPTDALSLLNAQLEFQFSGSREDLGTSWASKNSSV